MSELDNEIARHRKKVIELGRWAAVTAVMVNVFLGLASICASNYWMWWETFSVVMICGMLAILAFCIPAVIYHTFKHARKVDLYLVMSKLEGFTNRRNRNVKIYRRWKL